MRYLRVFDFGEIGIALSVCLDFDASIRPKAVRDERLAFEHLAVYARCPLQGFQGALQDGLPFVVR
ncbi:MAG: hypothetical protein Q7J42_10105 [Sulfuritalea sp.]|nr:hypothetical protein [Sulfuritalea sp.]